MKFATLIFLAMVLVVPAISPAEEIEGPETASEASTRLLMLLNRDHVYPNIAKRCLGTVQERSDDYSFDFAVHYNQKLCGGDAQSTLLDRFRVFARSNVVLYYDVVNDRYLYYDSFLKGRHGK